MRSAIPLVIVAFGILLGTSLALATETTASKTGTTTFQENRLRHAGEDRDIPGAVPLNRQPAPLKAPGV